MPALTRGPSTRGTLILGAAAAVGLGGAALAVLGIAYTVRPRRPARG